MDPIALSQAGPVAILLFFISAMVVGFLRGDVVPGWLYKAEKEQRIKAETQAERNAVALEALARAAANGVPHAGPPKRG